MVNPLETQVGGGHYKSFKIQPIEFIHANKIPFIEGSIIKYASRWRDKGGLQDLEKIKYYCDLLIKLEDKLEELNIADFMSVNKMVYAVSNSDRSGLEFHIESDDYFGTLATILDLDIQAKQLTNPKLVDDLLYLQKHYKIVKKDEI